MLKLEEPHYGPFSEWEDNTKLQNYLLIGISVLLVVFAGLMSGLTLGLMSLDLTQMEVLKRSGTAKERDYATKIMPVLQNSHFLLCTLLLCNAGAMEALPLFLDRLANPLLAILLSVTAVLFFGEIIPQSVCTRYGLAIGANLAWFVRILMVICSPIAWPLGKVLDKLLGVEHHELFRRKQLKALVDIHGEETGLGGKLSKDEIKVITGALDLTHKTASKAMTPLSKVFMLSSDAKLDQPTLKSILDSGHSRVPVHMSGDKRDLVGIILVKELLQYKMSQEVPVCMLKMRSLPRLCASTPMYDMLKLFQTGRSHMAVLTEPPVRKQTSMQRMSSVPEPPGSSHLGSPFAGSPNPQEIEPECSTPRIGGMAGDYSDPCVPPNFGSPILRATFSMPSARLADEDLDSEYEFFQTKPLLTLDENAAPRSQGGNGNDNSDLDSAPVEVGAPIGVITIEDVIEELIRAEIVDETDIFVDNLMTMKVNQAMLAEKLPERLRRIVKSNSDLAVVLHATTHVRNAYP